MDVVDVDADVRGARVRCDDVDGDEAVLVSGVDVVVVVRATRIRVIVVGGALISFNLSPSFSSRVINLSNSLIFFFFFGVMSGVDVDVTVDVDVVGGVSLDVTVRMGVDGTTPDVTTSDDTDITISVFVVVAVTGTGVDVGAEADVEADADVGAGAAVRDDGD